MNNNNTSDDEEDASLSLSPPTKEEEESEEPECRHSALNPHGYHRNLPSVHMDPKDGIPYVTKYAERKARYVVRLVRSIQLTEGVFMDKSLTREKQDAEEDNKDDDDDDDEDADEGDEKKFGSDDSMASIMKKCGRVQSQLSSLVTLKHSGITEDEMCDIILHILRLLSATVTITKKIDNQDGDENKVEIDGANREESVAVPSSGRRRHRHVSLHFDNVGRVLLHDEEKGIPESFTEKVTITEEEDPDRLPPNETEKRLSEPFALPLPARESLLSVAILLLTKKAPLRAVSNTALFPASEHHESVATTAAARKTLVINWKALLRMLLRTAPYLDERKVGTPPDGSHSRQSTVLKRTVNLIRHCRRFFDQGLRPCATSTSTRVSGGKSALNDATARSVWEMVKSDLLYNTHSNSCFRAVIMLYLFLPSRCTSEFYVNVMPSWLESWSSIDRCPEFDFLWLVLFCRARKYVTPGAYDWGVLRRRLLTLCGYWLQIPVGGSSDDRSFPRAAPPRSRGFPSRLKSFVGSGGSYQEGIDFVGKVSKLLAFCIGKNDLVMKEDLVKKKEPLDEAGRQQRLSHGTEDVLRFLSYVAPYFNPSNTGAWTFPLGAFLNCFSYEVCLRIGIAAGMDTLTKSHPDLAQEINAAEPYQTCIRIPDREVVALLDALLPLCQQALYSKNGHVGRAGESALVYLAEIDPGHVCPPFLDFASRALDISSVNLSHQAPAALSALTRLVQPSLRRRPSVLLERLPELLRLSLAGIDSNDQNKTIRTLILYRGLASWIPVGGRKQDWAANTFVHNNVERADGGDGTIRMGRNLMRDLSGPFASAMYQEAMDQLQESSLLYQGNMAPSFSSPDDDEHMQIDMLLEEAAMSMSDWSLALLDRIYVLLRAAGEQEKVGKSAVGVASRHSSADVRQARNFSRVMKECLVQVFSSMDSRTHETAVRSVSQFLMEETLPLAAKDASFLCQAVACSRSVNDGGQRIDTSPGLDALVPILTENLRHHSNKTVAYRLRCLSGAVRYAGRAVLNHRLSIKASLEYAFSVHDDKDLYKTGCKLLRHTLASLCEAYPIMSDCKPRILEAGSVSESKDTFQIGKSAELRGDNVQWHVPCGAQIDFACDLLNAFALARVDELGLNRAPLSSESETGANGESGSTGGESFVDVSKEGSGDDKSDDILSHLVISLPQWRRSLRVLRYALRGCAGILLDNSDEVQETVRAHAGRDKSGSFSEDGRGSSFASYDDEDDSDLVPHERAIRSIVVSASNETQESLLCLRGKLCAFVTQIMSFIASETADSESKGDTTSDKKSATSDSNGESFDDMEDSSSNCDEDAVRKPKRFSTAISTDAKVCKEIVDIANLLLTRRGASFRCQDSKTIWRAQKQLDTDYVLAAMSDQLASSLQRAALYCDVENTLYKDGEDGGKSISRRLLVGRIDNFHQSVQRNASFEIPRRLRRKRGRKSDSSRGILFSVDLNLDKLLALSSIKCPNALSGYEGIVDGLFALSCHPNIQVRSWALGGVDYALTRFSWLVRHRVPRLLSAVSLRDEDMKGKFGIPSCAQLVTQCDAQGKRMRLAEVLKGVCSIAAVPRSIRETLASEERRFLLVRTLCGTQRLISLLPPEEMQKMVHYLHGIFSQFRSRFFSVPRVEEKQQKIHESCIAFLLELLSVKDAIADGDDMKGDIDNPSGSAPANGDADADSMHWRNRLMVGWFLTSFVDGEDLLIEDPSTVIRAWRTCFHLIETEAGQPLQRVALGFFGRLVMLTLELDEKFDNIPEDQEHVVTPSICTNTPKERGLHLLCERLLDEKFCRSFGNALVFDHKEDGSVGGGHHAQWSAGIEEILRDASSNVAPRTLFPFQRTSRSSHTFKVQHAQLVHAILLAIGRQNARVTSQHLLVFAKELAASPPSEDQRNQMCTCAEIFAGVCRALLLVDNEPDEISDTWRTILIPFLDDVIPKIPISLSGAFFDAYRYGIHHFPPSTFFALTEWMTGKIETTLWQHQPKNDRLSENVKGTESDEKSSAPQSAPSSSKLTDGFASQSKWLFLSSAVLIELDVESDLGATTRLPWYLLDTQTNSGVNEDEALPLEDLRDSWKAVSQRLLPRLLNALGHPYEKCREHIAGCLFRICYCHRKFMSRPKTSTGDKAISAGEQDIDFYDQDPGEKIVLKLSAVRETDEFSFKEKYNAYITAQKFMAYCVHLGDAKNEFSEFVIRLLPLAFEALKATVAESTEEDDEKGTASAANRALELEVVKNYRYSLSEISSSCRIIYGKDEDLSRVLMAVEDASKHEFWQVRQAAAHFLRCFQGSHMFLFSRAQSDRTTNIVAALLADARREVSAAAMAALTGILAATPLPMVTNLVEKYVAIVKRSIIKRKKKKVATDSMPPPTPAVDTTAAAEKEKARARRQQTSVFFLCASILARPYDTPKYVPEALAAISKHSFERSAPLAVRETVKRSCAEFKRTHMSDNWEVHRKQFSQEQLEALEDVVSTPHYYA